MGVWRQLPGFRTGTRWKQVVAGAAYILVVLVGIGMLVTAPLLGIAFLLVVLVVSLLVTNIWGIRSRVPLLSSPSRLAQSGGWFVLALGSVVLLALASVPYAEEEEDSGGEVQSPRSLVDGDTTTTTPATPTLVASLQATPTPLPAPTTTPTSVVTPSPTPEATPAPTPVPTAAPTPTPAPMATPTSTPAPTSTPMPSLTPVPAAAVAITAAVGGPPGGNASVTAQAPPGATCRISYTTPSGTPSEAAGLGPATATTQGRVSWMWAIGPSTRPGMGRISVTCMPGGTATAPITIG
jgi:hypothetical protein